MKKLLVILALFAFTGLAFADCTCNKPNCQCTKEKGYISVNTSVEEEFAPNIAYITFTVETGDKDATVASNKNKEITSKVIEELKKLLDTQKGDVIKTYQFSVSPQYSYRNNKQIFEKYNVVNSFEVKLKDTSKLGKVLNMGIEAGATRVSNLRYTMDLDNAICNELIARATQDARERANTVAKAMNTKVAGVKQASVSCSIQGNMNFRNNFMMKAMSAADGAVAENSSVPAETGTMKVIASFSGQFYTE